MTLKTIGAVLFFLPLFLSGAVFAEQQPLPETQGIRSPSKQVRILLVSQNEATLSSPLNAPILEIPFRLGDTFKAGDALVKFQCDRRKGELTKARAEYRIASDTLKNHRQLRRYESISELEVAVSQGELQRAGGGLAIARAEAAKCTLQAPFDGTVVREYVSPHEYVKAGEPMLDVIDLDTPEAQIYIPLSWLRQLEMGERIDIIVDEMDLSV
ncbi:MAG: HlyD family secretion protein [Candidatus Kentron sp. G]|nr:MAG: HlyD family secretion protein [Candidatus Kentron sp. G]VFM98689.1 MAG: HlyD family secretion protein [Candidatus Kentron sp. G]VFN02460.1 MAG: HlyD family secretion protein [Candidatus Kentron sp. G]